MSGALSVRRTTDLDVVRRLDARLFGKGERATDREIERCTWWVATLSGEPVAYAGARICETDPTLVYFSRCGVLPAARGRGLQRRLVRVRLAWSRRQRGRTHAITYTMPHNAPSSNNLIRCGFKTYEANWVGADVVYWIRALCPIRRAS